MDFDNKNLFVEEGEEDDRPSKEDRILAMGCYVHFFFVAPLFMGKDSEFVNFHMKQGGVLYALFIICVMVTSVLLIVTSSVRFLGLTMVVFLIYTGICIWLGAKAYSGKKKEFSLIAPIVLWVSEMMEKHKDDE